MKISVCIAYSIRRKKERNKKNLAVCCFFKLPKKEKKMAEMVMEATVQFMVEKLLAVATDEIGRVFGIRTEIANLKRSLSMIQAFLHDAAMRQVEDEAVKLWLKDLEHAGYRVEILLDVFHYEITRRKIETGMKRKLMFYFSFTKPLVFRVKMARQIKDVNANLRMLNEEANTYGLHTRIVESAVALPSIRETNSLSVDPIVVGRENDASKILDMLLNPSQEEVLSVIPIVGMGGLGKTTLARSIFNDPKATKHFDESIWVCVSKDFDTTKVFKRILEILTKEVVQEESMESIVRKIREKLDAKRFLLILDDLWNDSKEDWENFRSSLLGINLSRRNFIIATTRLESVASTVRTQPMYSLNKLSDDDCWTIIKTKAFSPDEATTSFEVIGKEIACRCGGLPLAANLIGGTLREKQKEDWIEVLQGGLLNLSIQENGVLPILKVSYDRLHSPLLKKCFAYCSIFIKDEIIEKERLVQLWMAEGLLLQNNNDDMESLGNKIYDILLQNSFLQEAEKDKYGNTVCSKMHNLVHDLAISISKAECFNDKNQNISNIPSQVRYLAVKSLGEEAHKIIKEDATYLRTLFLGRNVADNVFKDLKYLRVLDLQKSNIEEMTGSIGMLIHLRLLDVSFTRIKALPEFICKLFYLQTLRAIRCNKLERFPDKLYLLFRLRHVIISSDHIELFPMPLGIGKLTCLRTLDFFNVGHEKGRGVEELGYLKNLKGKLMINYLERVNDIEEASRADLIGKPNIQELEFNWSTKSRQGNNNDKEVLEGLRPHSNVKSLTIRRYNGDNFPSWVMKMKVADVASLKNLIEVRLIDCERCEEIPTLGHLPLLKILELNGLINVESIDPSFYYPYDWNEIDISTGNHPQPFRALQRFYIKNMGCLKKWGAPKKSSKTSNRVHGFPILEYLEISDCKLETIPPHDFSSLKELVIENSDGNLLLDIVDNNLRSLMRLKLKQINHNLTCLPSKLFSNNPNLAFLEIRYCSMLTKLEFPDEDGHNFDSLEELCILDCSSLASIGYTSGRLLCLTSVRNLAISSCSKLASPRIDWQRMNRLYLVHLGGCPNWRTLPQDISVLHSVRAFGYDFSEDDDIDLLSEILQAIGQLHSLWHLTLWHSLPDEFQQLTKLTNLSHLMLVNLNIEALPEWLGNISTLETLHLTNCEKLRYLPSKEAMQRLSKLTWLVIWNCPLLKERCSTPQPTNMSITDSEWPKISHIPNVTLN